MNLNKIINENQYGFVEHSSTLAASPNCVEKIYDHIDKSKYASVISIDLEKAFDSVNIQELIQKLKKLKLNEIQTKLFQSFLIERKQATVVNGIKSEYKTVKNGVPQMMDSLCSSLTQLIN